MEYDHPGDGSTTYVVVIFRVKASLIPSMDKIQITFDSEVDYHTGPSCSKQGKVKPGLEQHLNSVMKV